MFAKVAISVHASMSLAVLIAVQSETAPHLAWGSDAGPARRLHVCVKPVGCGKMQTAADEYPNIRFRCVTGQMQFANAFCRYLEMATLI